MEQTIKEKSKQITTLLKMNENLVKALMMAQGVKVADKDKSEDKIKKPTKMKEWRMCQFCKEKHKGAGKGCLRRKCNVHLRLDSWKGEEVDE